MSGELDWEKRRPIARDKRRIGKFDTTAKAAFEALVFFRDNPEPRAGNFVIIPGRWESMSEAELHERRIVHRRQRCAEDHYWFDRASGDRWVRISNETVETFKLRNCEVCSEHIRRQ